MAHKVEKVWDTKAGLRAVVLIVLREDGSRRNRCGYVGVPVGHPLHGVDYGQKVAALGAAGKAALEGSIGKRGVLTALCAGFKADPEGSEASPELTFNVHGGITYSGASGKYPVEGPEWWFGFDCAHYDDGDIDPCPFGLSSRGEARSMEYVADECESLAAQIVEAVPSRKGEQAMSESKHTAGQMFSIGDKLFIGGSQYARCWNSTTNISEDEANAARLCLAWNNFDAGVEALEACKLILSGDTKEGYIAANSAIRKAEGQPAAKGGAK